MYVLSTFNQTIFFWFQLLLEMKKVNFTLEKRQFYFDKSSLATGYELINWVKGPKKRHFEVIGGYTVAKRTLDIDEKTIEWHTPNKTVRPATTYWSDFTEIKFVSLFKPCNVCNICIFLICIFSDP